MARGSGSGSYQNAEPKPVIIAVFGKTGTGKTSFVRNVTNANFDVGHGLSSQTKDVQAAEAFIDGRKVVLVDTPGFDDTHLSDTEVLSRIADWLKYTYDEGALLSGLIFLHSISNDRMEGSALKNLGMFRKLCGENNLGNVILATTKWSYIHPTVGEQREQELRYNFWASMIEKGSRISRLYDNPDSAHYLVREAISNSAVVLQLQQELANGLRLAETAAGSELARALGYIEDTYKNQLDTVKRELEKARAQENQELKRAHKEEIRRLEIQIKSVTEERDDLYAKHVARLAKCTRKWWQRSWRCLELCGTKTRRSGPWMCPTCDREQNNVSY